MNDERSYLSVRDWKRHRHYANRSLPWIKYHVDRLDDGVLADLPVTTRLFADLLLLLAARMDNKIPNDPRRIAGWVALPTREVRRAIEVLTRYGYCEVNVGALWSEAGDMQPQLPLAQPGASEGDRASTAAKDSLALRARESRAEQRRPSSKARQSLGSKHGSALPPDTTNLNGQGPEIVRRMIGLVCRGDEASAAILRAEAAGMPERVLARALESYIGRRPRPANPAGYLVNAIRSIAREAGVERERVSIEREPEL